MLAGWIIVESLGRTGIHFSCWGEGFEAIGFAAIVYPVSNSLLFHINYCHGNSHSNYLLSMAGQESAEAGSRRSNTDRMI